MIIYKTKYVKFQFEETGQIVKYTKNIFGKSWSFSEIVRKDLTKEEAKQIKKKIQEQEKYFEQNGI